jgi:hypothetical protein
MSNLNGTVITTGMKSMNVAAGTTEATTAGAMAAMAAATAADLTRQQDRRRN